MDNKFKKERIPWNKGLKGSPKTIEMGRKMAETRKKNGWFKDIDKFKKKRSDYMKSDKNHFLNKKQDKSVIDKIVKTRKDNNSYAHSSEWCKNHSNGMIGDKNPNWIDGLSRNPYGLEFNKDLKEVIRNRDRRKCQICGKIELYNNRELSIHHIDYNKQNNDPKNLIALCDSCHSKTNFNREKWINYFGK